GQARSPVIAARLTRWPEGTGLSSVGFFGFFQQAGWAHRTNAAKALDDAERGRRTGDLAAYERALAAAETEITLMEDAARGAARFGELRFGAKARKSRWN